jgi:hypothetical protein
MFESPERKACRHCGAANLMQSVYCCICSARFELIDLSDAQRREVDLLVKKAEAMGLPRGALFPIEGRSNRLVTPRGWFWPARLADFKFVTNPASQTATLESAAILVSDVELGNLASLAPLQERASEDSVALALVAPSYSPEFLAALLLGKLKGVLKGAALVSTVPRLPDPAIGARSWNGLPRVRRITASLFGAFVEGDSGPAGQACFLEFGHESMLRLAIDLLAPRREEGCPAG